VFTPPTPTRQNSFVASASAVCIGHNRWPHATSETVKRCWSRVYSWKQLYSSIVSYHWKLASSILFVGIISECRCAQAITDELPQRLSDPGFGSSRSLRYVANSNGINNGISSSSSSGVYQGSFCDSDCSSSTVTAASSIDFDVLDSDSRSDLNHTLARINSLSCLLITLKPNTHCRRDAIQLSSRVASTSAVCIGLYYTCVRLFNENTFYCRLINVIHKQRNSL